MPFLCSASAFTSDLVPLLLPPLILLNRPRSSTANSCDLVLSCRSCVNRELPACSRVIGVGVPKERVALAEIKSQN